MADDFKALVALTKETNAKLELLHRQGDKDSSPRERILDATPEILSMERVMNKEKAQRAKLHKEDQINRNKGEKETVQAVKETSKETSKPIVEVVKEDIKFSSIFNNNLLTSIDSGNMKLIGSSVLGSEKISLSLNGLTNAFEKESKESMKFSKFFSKINPLSFFKTTGAQAAEDEKKKEKRQELFNKGLKGLGDGIKSLARKGFDKIKSGLSGLAKFALGGLALAALAFLNDPKFQKMASAFIDDIIPAVAKAYDFVVEKLQKHVFPRLLKLFKSIGKLFTDPKYGIFDLLNENILAVSGIAILLAPGVFGTALKLAFSGLFGALKLLPSMATKMLGVGALAGGIFNLQQDFQKEYNKTGSVSKSFAAALASEGEGGVAQALGNLGKFGLIGFAAGMAFTPLGAIIGGIAGSFIDAYLGFIGKGAVEKKIAKFKEIGDRIFGTIVDTIGNFLVSISLRLKSIFGGGLSAADKKLQNKTNLSQEKISLRDEKLRLEDSISSMAGVNPLKTGFQNRLRVVNARLDTISPMDGAKFAEFRKAEEKTKRLGMTPLKFRGLERFDIADMNDAMPQAVISAPYIDQKVQSSTMVTNNVSIPTPNQIVMMLALNN